MQKVLSLKYVKIFFTIQIVLIAISLYNYKLNTDEAWLGEQAFFLAKDGYAHSNLFKGFVHHDQRLVVYHRLFILAGSYFIKLFGFKLAALRLVTLLSGMALLVIMTFYLKRQLKYKSEQILLTVLVFTMMPLNYYAFKLYRPEMMVAMFGFASYYFLFINSKSTKIRYSVFAAICSTCAMLAHLNGAIFVMAGFVILMWHKQWKQSMIYCFVVLIVFSPYLYDIITHYGVFVDQITNRVIAEKTQFTFITPWLRLANEQKRLFHNPHIIFTTLLFFLSVLMNIKEQFNRKLFFYKYLLLLGFFLAVLIDDKTTKYATALLPFFALEIADAIYLFNNQNIPKSYRLGSAYLFLLCIFLMHSIFYEVKNTFLHKEDFVAVSREIGSYIPDGEWCLSSMILIFNEVERINIVSFFLANLESKSGLSVDEVKSFSKKHGVNYIVIDNFFVPPGRFKNLDAHKDELLNTFRILKTTDNYTIYERIR